MSFDLYFLYNTPGRHWLDQVEELEDAEQSPLDDAALDTWQQLTERLAAVLPGMDATIDENWGQLSHDPSGLQLTFSAAEVSLTIPYGPSAETAATAVVPLLRRVTEIVEDVTGRIAYDPQADRPFLAGGDRLAHESFASARRVLDGAAPAAAASRRHRWFRRRRGTSGGEPVS